MPLQNLRCRRRAALRTVQGPAALLPGRRRHAAACPAVRRGLRARRGRVVPSGRARRACAGRGEGVLG